MSRSYRAALGFAVEALLELREPQGLRVGLELDLVPARRGLLRDQARLVLEAALVEQERLRLLVQLHGGQPLRLEGRGQLRRHAHLGERDVLDVDAVRLELGVDRRPQHVGLGAAEVEGREGRHAADHRPQRVLGGAVEELVEVARGDRVGELHGVGDVQREDRVDVHADAVGRADLADRDVERDLAGRDDVAQREDRADAVDAVGQDAVVVPGHHDEPHRARAGSG